MRTVPFADVDLAADWLRTARIIKIECSTTYRFTDYPQSVVIGGDTYVNRGFSVGAQVMDLEGQQAAEVTFDDIDGTIRGILLTEGFRDRLVTIYEVMFNLGTGDVLGSLATIQGRCESVEIDLRGNPTAKMQITGSKLPWTSLGPRTDLQEDCPYTFKDEYCAYPTYTSPAHSGATVCNKKIMGDCLTYNNTTRFGGNPWAPHPGDKIMFGEAAAEVPGARPFPERH